MPTSSICKTVTLSSLGSLTILNRRSRFSSNSDLFYFQCGIQYPLPSVHCKQLHLTQNSVFRQASLFREGHYVGGNCNRASPTDCWSSSFPQVHVPRNHSTEVCCFIMIERPQKGRILSLCNGELRQDRLSNCVSTLLS